MSYVVTNTLSEETLVPGTERYILASLLAFSVLNTKQSPYIVRLGRGKLVK